MSVCFGGRRLCLAAPSLRARSGRYFGSASEVVQCRDEGLLLLPGSGHGPDEPAKAALSRGSIVNHKGLRWVCTFPVDRFWYAAPLGVSSEGSSGSSSPAASQKAHWLRRHDDDASACPDEEHEIAEAAVKCLWRPTPTQAQRVPLTECVPSGIVAVDVLAPLGMGQSMLICGPHGAGKSTIAREILHNVLTAGRLDKALRFCDDPCAPLIDAALQRSAGLEEMMALPSEESLKSGFRPAELLAPLFAALNCAEELRDAGKHVLIVLDSVAPVLAAWDLGLEMASAALGRPVDTELAAAQRRGFFANLFERAAILAHGGGSLTLLALVETEAMAALASAKPRAAAAEAWTYSLSDFDGRRPGELERLRRLEARGVKLTESNLTAVGIVPPVKCKVEPDIHGASSISEVRHSPKLSEEVAGREMQSLSDGQVVLDATAASAGRFPAVMPGATFSRFGLGSSASAPDAPPRQVRDVRPPALQAVAAHLRMQMALEQEAHFRPSSGAADHTQSARMEAVKATLLQPQGYAVSPEEMTVLLLVACGGALDELSTEEACVALQGGGNSTLLHHLHETAPQVFRKIAQEHRLSESVLRELEVAVRLFVALRKAGGGGRTEP